MLIAPNDVESLRSGSRGGGEVVVAYDGVGAREGDRVGFSEGREAAMPFLPEDVAVDAYLACILDDVTFEA
jgi:ethanolamine utilization protein EutN